MFKKTNSNNFLAIIFGASAFASALVLHKYTTRPNIKISKQESATNVNSTFLRFFSMGNKRLLSNYIWIQSLLESDLDRNRQRDENDWMYLRFKTIADLDEKFYENYLYGGLFLSIIKDDLKGAADIYERGLSQYPNDYELNYNAGFNYYFEMGNFEKGLQKLEKISTNSKAPPALKFIIHKLKFETGKDFDAALAFLYLVISQTKDENLLKKLRSDYYALKAERDLNCLNEELPNCDSTDAEGHRYIRKAGKWTAQKSFIPYKIHLRK